MGAVFAIEHLSNDLNAATAKDIYFGFIGIIPAWELLLLLKPAVMRHGHV